MQVVNTGKLYNEKENDQKSVRWQQEKRGKRNITAARNKLKTFVISQVNSNADKPRLFF